jgi:hypothetical protein
VEHNRYSFHQLWKQYRTCGYNKRNAVNALRFDIDAGACLYGRTSGGKRLKIAS